MRHRGRSGTYSLLLPARGIAFNGGTFAVTTLANDKLAAQAATFAPSLGQQPAADRTTGGTSRRFDDLFGAVGGEFRGHARPSNASNPMYTYTQSLTGFWAL